MAVERSRLLLCVLEGAAVGNRASSRTVREVRFRDRVVGPAVAVEVKKGTRDVALDADADVVTPPIVRGRCGSTVLNRGRFLLPLLAVTSVLSIEYTP